MILLVMQSFDNSLRVFSRKRRGRTRLRTEQDRGKPNPTYIPIANEAARVAAAVAVAGVGVDDDDLGGGPGAAGLHRVAAGAKALGHVRGNALLDGGVHGLQPEVAPQHVRDHRQIEIPPDHASRGQDRRSPVEQLERAQRIQSRMESPKPIGEILVELLMISQEDLDRAEANNDAARSASVRAELDAIVEELARATGLSGRSRAMGSRSERARSAVTWRIRSAIKKIHVAHPRLGQHLSNSIRTGNFCVYSPESAIEWEL